MKFFIFSISLFFCAFSWAQMPAGAAAGIAQFKMGSAELPGDYISNLPNVIHNLLLASEHDFNSKIGSVCRDLTNVQYISEFQYSDQPLIKEFESSFIRIEVAKCLPNSTADKVLAMMTNLEFKKKAFSTLTSITPNGQNGTCETTTAPLLGSSHYCYKNFLDKSNSKYLQLFSINDWFEVTSQYSVPVYFRETIQTTTQIGNDVQLHSISYVRGPRLSAVHKLFAKNFITSAQTDVFNKLAEALQ